MKSLKIIILSISFMSISLFAQTTFNTIGIWAVGDQRDSLVTGQTDFETNMILINSGANGLVNTFQTTANKGWWEQYIDEIDNPGSTTWNLFSGPYVTETYYNQIFDAFDDNRSDSAHEIVVSNILLYYLYLRLSNSEASSLDYLDDLLDDFKDLADSYSPNIHISFMLGDEPYTRLWKNNFAAITSNINAHPEFSSFSTPTQRQTRLETIMTNLITKIRDKYNSYSPSPNIYLILDGNAFANNNCNNFSYSPINPQGLRNFLEARNNSSSSIEVIPVFDIYFWNTNAKQPDQLDICQLDEMVKNMSYTDNKIINLYGNRMNRYQSDNSIVNWGWPFQLTKYDMFEQLALVKQGTQFTGVFLYSFSGDNDLNILITDPYNLRNQWNQSGTEKFNEQIIEANSNKKYKLSVITAPGPSSSYQSHIKSFALDQNESSWVNGCNFVDNFGPSDNGFRYGANIASGDIDGDGLDELITAPGPGPNWPHRAVVNIWKNTGSGFYWFKNIDYPQTFGASIYYGARVATGDIDGDMIDEVIVAKGNGPYHEPDVKIFKYRFNTSSFVQFSSLCPSWYNCYGANITCGDFNNDGQDELAVSPGYDPYYGPRVNIYNFEISSDGSSASASLLYQIYDYEPFGSGVKYGANLASGDLNKDGLDELIISKGANYYLNPQIRVYSFDVNSSSSTINSYNVDPDAIYKRSYAYFNLNQYWSKYGANVACGDIDGDCYEDLIIGPGPYQYSGAHVFIYDIKSLNNPVFRRSIPPSSTYPGAGYGVNVAAGFFTYNYNLRKISDEQIYETMNEQPTDFKLNQNYPNPFNPVTMIVYQLPKAFNVQIKIYNMLGEEVITLVDGKMEKGVHSAIWNASEYSSGVYFYKLIAGSHIETKKMLLMR